MIYTNTRSKKKPQNTSKRKRLQEDWEILLNTWGCVDTKKEKPKPLTVSKKIPPRGESKDYPSLGSGVGNAFKKDINNYTGHEMLGIAIVHKSCLQPVFSQQEAEDVARMRR